MLYPLVHKERELVHLDPIQNFLLRVCKVRVCYHTCIRVVGRSISGILRKYRGGMRCVCVVHAFQFQMPSAQLSVSNLFCNILN